MTTEKLITARQLAEFLGVSVAAIYQHARAGRIPHHRFGDRLLFRADEVLAATHVPATENFENRKIGASEL